MTRQAKLDDYKSIHSEIFKTEEFSVFSLKFKKVFRQDQIWYQLRKILHEVMVPYYLVLGLTESNVLLISSETHVFTLWLYSLLKSNQIIYRIIQMIIKCSQREETITIFEELKINQFYFILITKCVFHKTVRIQASRSKKIKSKPYYYCIIPKVELFEELSTSIIYL